MSRWVAELDQVVLGFELEEALMVNMAFENLRAALSVACASRCAPPSPAGLGADGGGTLRR